MKAITGNESSPLKGNILKARSFSQGAKWKCASRVHLCCICCHEGHSTHVFHKTFLIKSASYCPFFTWRDPFCLVSLWTGNCVWLLKQEVENQARDVRVETKSHDWQWNRNSIRCAWSFDSILFLFCVLLSLLFSQLVTKDSGTLKMLSDNNSNTPSVY